MRSQGVLYSLEIERQVMIKGMVGKQLRVEPWMRACLNENVQRETVEAVASASVLRKEVKKMLSDTV